METELNIKREVISQLKFRLDSTKQDIDRYREKFIRGQAEYAQIENLIRELEGKDGTTNNPTK